ncbi:MAG TPA: alpha/beta hydrolase-fold protein [Mucilaginibacter sp.]
MLSKKSSAEFINHFNQRLFCCFFLLLSQCLLVSAQQKVTFKIGKIPPLEVSGQHPFVSGNFNNWNPADSAWELRSTQSGSYQLVKNLPKGTYNFKVTRGNWQTVECNKSGNPIENRTIAVIKDTIITIDIEGWQDNFTATEKKHTATAQVHIVSEKFDMPQLGRQRRVWIYLPADYQSSQRRYPVIYMHDGQNLFDAATSAYGEWGIDEILDKLPAHDQCIVVGIDHGGENRITEYNPYDSKYGKGRGDDYVEFIVKTLKPYIDQQYRTNPDAQHTTILGSSMGGLISMYAALKYPDVFGNAGVFSPAFWLAPQLYQFARQADLPTKSSFYFVCGDAESESEVTDMTKMADIIRSKGISDKQSPIVVIKGAAHNEKQWNGDFPGFYSWLMQF